MRRAEGLHRAGMIDNTTMREFDQDCLTPILELSPTVIRKIRTKGLNQSVRIRRPPKCHDRSCEQVGTRRKAAAWASREAAFTRS